MYHCYSVVTLIMEAAYSRKSVAVLSTMVVVDYNRSLEPENCVQITILRHADSTYIELLIHFAVFMKFLRYKLSSLAECVYLFLNVNGCAFRVTIRFDNRFRTLL